MAKKNKKRVEDLKKLAEGKLTARVYDKDGNLKEEHKNVRVKGEGSVKIKKRGWQKGKKEKSKKGEKDRKNWGEKSWKRRKK